MPVAEIEQPLEIEIDPQLQEELLKHAGKWVAMTRSELLAVADTPGAAYSAARERGISEPIIYRVPDASTSYFF